MRKIISIMVMVLAVSVFFVSCGEKKATPSDVAVEAYKDLFAGDGKVFMSHVAGTDEEIKKAEIMVETALIGLQGNGIVLKSIEATSETIAEDGKTAVVNLAVVSTKDGVDKPETSDVKLALVDGKWTLKIDVEEMQ